MARPAVHQVPEGSGEQRKMEETGCEIICGAPTTVSVKGQTLMMMIMKALSLSGLPSICTILMQTQIRSAGLVGRTPDQRLPKDCSTASYSKESAPTEEKNKNKNKKRFKGTLKRPLKTFGMNPDTLERTAEN